MKILAVFALLCAVMALTTAFPAPEEEPQEAPKAAPEEELEEASEILFDVEKRDTQGWTPIGDRFFRYESRDLSWYEAEINCQSLGGHLASIHSFVEYNLIQSLVTPSGNPRAWIGGNDRLRKGHWQWTDGTNFIYSNWCSGEPNNSGGEDCLEISYTDHKCWNDVGCRYPFPSVCVKNK